MEECGLGGWAQDDEVLEGVVVEVLDEERLGVWAGGLNACGGDEGVVFEGVEEGVLAVGDEDMVTRIV